MPKKAARAVTTDEILKVAESIADEDKDLMDALRDDKLT